MNFCKSANIMTQFHHHLKSAQLVWFLDIRSVPWWSLLIKAVMVTYVHVYWYLTRKCKTWPISVTSLFLLIWPYLVQMHNMPCINCFDWSFLLNSLFFNSLKKKFNSWDEVFHLTKCFSMVIMQCFVFCFGGEMKPVWICDLSLDMHSSLFTMDINNHCSSHWPLTFTLYLALCVCPSHDCGNAMTSPLSDALPGMKTENQ